MYLIMSVKFNIISTCFSFTVIHVRIAGDNGLHMKATCGTNQLLLR